MVARPRLVLVTDPMCSWCWGMADEFEQARVALANDIQFDLMLGGINVHGTQPIGDYGRRFMRRLWQEVADTTGQRFGQLYADEYVHNSVLPCLALHTINQWSGEIRFDALHRLQRDFFVNGVNINNRTYLIEFAEELGIEIADFTQRLEDPAALEQLKFQFEMAGQFGTQALPSLLIADDPDEPAKLGLLAGGYVDAGMLQTLLDSRLSR